MIPARLKTLRATKPEGQFNSEPGFYKTLQLKSGRNVAAEGFIAYWSSDRRLQIQVDATRWVGRNSIDLTFTLGDGTVVDFKSVADNYSASHIHTYEEGFGSATLTIEGDIGRNHSVAYYDGVETNTSVLITE